MDRDTAQALLGQVLAPWVGALGLQHGERIVRAAVVHVDDFVVDAPAQGGGDFGQQRRDVVALVEHRHDDGELGHWREAPDG